MYSFCNDGRAPPPGNDCGKLESGKLVSLVGCLQGGGQGLEHLTFSPALTQAWSHSLAVEFPVLPMYQLLPASAVAMGDYFTFPPPGPGQALDL